jgi:hypothetical protein
MDGRIPGGGPVRALAALFFVLTAACAGASDSAQVTRTRPPSMSTTGSSMDIYVPTGRAIVTNVIRATPVAAWNALAQVYADFGIEVKERSEADHVLGNPRFVISRRMVGAPMSTYLECGSGLKGPFADSYRIEMLIRSAVYDAEAGGSRIDTYVEATARNPEGTSNTAVVCSSTQRLEREIAERVRLYAEGR